MIVTILPQCTFIFTQSIHQNFLLLAGERQRPETFMTALSTQLFIGIDSILWKQNRHNQSYDIARSCSRSDHEKNVAATTKAENMECNFIILFFP